MPPTTDDQEHPSTGSESSNKNTPEEDLEQLGHFSAYLRDHERNRKRLLLERLPHPSTRPTIQEDGRLTAEARALELEGARDSNVRDLNLSAMRQERVTRWIHDRQENTDGRVEVILRKQAYQPTRRELWIVLGGVWLLGLILGLGAGAIASAGLGWIF